MKAKLTDKAIQAYRPRAKQYAIGDAACPGLRIRITPKGIKTFAFAYRNKGTGKVEWLTLGRYPDVPLARAREVANDARKTAALRHARRYSIMKDGTTLEILRSIQADLSVLQRDVADVVASLTARGRRRGKCL